MKSQRMSGKALQGAIIELAHMYGWRCAHFPSVLVTGRNGKPYFATPLAADAKGFPDLVLVRPDDRMMFAEVKGTGDVLRAEQNQWINDLRSAGCEVHLWLPQDLDSGYITTTLQEYRGR